jgi:hypothetical protein
MAKNAILLVFFGLLAGTLVKAEDPERALARWYAAPTCCKAGKVCSYRNKDRCW